jgi:hypothetical protein
MHNLATRPDPESRSAHRVFPTTDKVTTGGDGIDLILSRESGLTRGAVLRLLWKEADPQRKFINELKETGKRPRKRRMRKKRAMITIPRQPKAIVEALVKQLSAEELAAVAQALGEVVHNQVGKRKS